MDQLALTEPDEMCCELTFRSSLLALQFDHITPCGIHIRLKDHGDCAGVLHHLKVTIECHESCDLGAAT